jgi:3-deoxy-D-manno-octulosonic-acid transferase
LYLLYTLLMAIGLTFALPFYLWRGRSSGKYLRTFRARLGNLPPDLPLGQEGPAIWIHAVSVGEVLAARPLVEALSQRLPRHRVFVSTTTLTGNAVAGQSVRGAAGLFYAPFDFPGPVKRALRAVDPVVLVLVETEIWPNLIHEARRRGAKVVMVNGRISPRSFSRYRLVRGLLSRVLAEVDLFLMQGQAHAKRIRELGAPEDRVHVTGNLKFDAAEPPRVSQALARGLGPAARGGRLLVVAGSTSAGEDESVIAAFLRVRQQVPEAALLIAPRKPERFAEVPALLEAAGLRCRLRSALDEQPWSGDEVVLLDTLGELAQVYALADVVFVGGSLVPQGGHNVLEPAVAGKAIVVGPHMENFQEIADQFLSEDALVVVSSEEELAAELCDLLADPERRKRLGDKAKTLVERNRGAVARTVEALAQLAC